MTADAETSFTSHTVQKTISCAMSEKTVEVNPTHLPVSAWMSQHSSRDAVTEWICLGLSTDEDDAGLNDDDNPSPTEVTRPSRTSGPEHQTSESHGNKD